MVNVAILGSDDETREIVRAVTAQRDLTIVGLYDVSDEQAATLTDLLPPVRRLTTWEDLLANHVDVVLVGRLRPAAHADDQLRKLVQAGCRLLLTFPPCEAILALELEMIRRDSGAPLAIVYPGCLQAIPQQWGQAYRDHSDSPLGRLEQILVERFQSRRSRDDVLTQLARDVHWLQPVSGDIRQVSALAGGGESPDLSNLSVQMVSEAGIPFRWSVRPALDDSVDQVTLVGSHGQVQLLLPRRSGAWTILDARGPTTVEQPASGAEAVELLRALASQPSGRAQAAQASPWPAAVRAMEVVDTVTYSLRRGRTIDLPQTQVSEEKTFKAVMSATGCLLMLLAPALLIGAALVERLLNSFQPRTSGDVPSVQSDGSTSGTGKSPQLETSARGSPAQLGPSATPSRRIPWLALALVSPLLVFLLLQSLQIVFRSRAGPPANSP